jgi:monoamine oxidase
MNSIISSDYIVVGAGVSGMTAAKRLHEAGASVLVFDGKDRVGGRTWSDSDKTDGAIDYGGMFIGATHDRSQRLGTSLGLEMVKARPAGKCLWNLGDELLVAEDGSYPDKTLADGSDLKAGLTAAFKAIDTLAAKVGKDAPWDHPDAHELDGKTMATWIEETIEDPLVRRIVGSDVTIITGADPSEISLLFFAFYVAQCEDMYALQVTANVSLWIGGAQQITTRIADLLPEGSIRLGEPVTAISQDDGGVQVTTAQGAYRARRVILALPPSAAAQMTFSPPLPSQRRQINRRTNLGRYMKLQIRFKDQFWVDKGFSGEVFSLEPAFLSLDVTRPGDATSTIAMFMGGSRFEAWYNLGLPERRSKILDTLAKCFGDEALSPTDYVETYWDEVPFTGGGPVSYMPPGLLSNSGAALRAPVGRIHFAGTEAAPAWTGYMEGAVRAGEAAVHQVQQLP